jgi:hypothetical protein
MKYEIKPANSPDFSTLGMGKPKAHYYKLYPHLSGPMVQLSTATGCSEAAILGALCWEQGQFHPACRWVVQAQAAKA